MKYPHIVVVDGVWYSAGQEVPADDTTSSKEIKAEISEEKVENGQTSIKSTRGRKRAE